MPLAEREIGPARRYDSGDFNRLRRRKHQDGNSIHPHALSRPWVLYRRPGMQRRHFKTINVDTRTRTNLP